MRSLSIALTLCLAAPADPRGDAVRLAEKRLGQGDLAGGAGLLALIASDPSPSARSRIAQDELLLLRMTHQEAAARFKRGDGLGAAALAAWLLALPFTDRDPCPKGWLCLELSGGSESNPSFEKSDAVAGYLEDLAVFLAEGTARAPHPEMHRTGLSLAYQILDAVTVAFPERSASWLDLGDVSWELKYQDQASRCYARWWQLAEPAGQKLLPRVKERMGGSPPSP
jgi:hypothetical protein